MTLDEHLWCKRTQVPHVNTSWNKLLNQFKPWSLQVLHFAYAQRCFSASRSSNDFTLSCRDVEQNHWCFHSLLSLVSKHKSVLCKAQIYLKGSFAHLHPSDMLVHDFDAERCYTSTDRLNFPVSNDVIPLAQFCFLLWDAFKLKYFSEFSYATRSSPPFVSITDSQNSFLPLDTVEKNVFSSWQSPNAICNK